MEDYNSAENFCEACKSYPAMDVDAESFVYAIWMPSASIARVLCGRHLLPEFMGCKQGGGLYLYIEEVLYLFAKDNLRCHFCDDFVKITNSPNVLAKYYERPSARIYAALMRNNFKVVRFLHRLSKLPAFPPTYQKIDTIDLVDSEEETKFEPGSVTKTYESRKRKTKKVEYIVITSDDENNGESAPLVAKDSRIDRGGTVSLDESTNSNGDNQSRNGAKKESPVSDTEMKTDPDESVEPAAKRLEGWPFCSEEVFLQSAVKDEQPSSACVTHKEGPIIDSITDGMPNLKRADILTCPPGELLPTNVEPNFKHYVPYVPQGRFPTSMSPIRLRTSPIRPSISTESDSALEEQKVKLESTKKLCKTETEAVCENNSSVHAAEIIDLASQESGNSSVVEVPLDPKPPIELIDLEQEPEQVVDPDGQVTGVLVLDEENDGVSASPEKKKEKAPIALPDDEPPRPRLKFRPLSELRKPMLSPPPVISEESEEEDAGPSGTFRPLYEVRRPIYLNQSSSPPAESEDSEEDILIPEHFQSVPGPLPKLTRLSPIRRPSHIQPSTSRKEGEYLKGLQIFQTFKLFMKSQRQRSRQEDNISLKRRYPFSGPSSSESSTKQPERPRLLNVFFKVYHESTPLTSPPDYLAVLLEDNLFPNFEEIANLQVHYGQQTKLMFILYSDKASMNPIIITTSP